MSCYRHIIQCMTFLKTSFIASVVSVQTGSCDDEVIQVSEMENGTNRASPFFPVFPRSCKMEMSMLYS